MVKAVTNVRANREDNKYGFHLTANRVRILSRGKIGIQRILVFKAKYPPTAIASVTDFIFQGLDMRHTKRMQSSVWNTSFFSTYALGSYLISKFLHRFISYSTVSQKWKMNHFGISFVFSFYFLYRLGSHKLRFSGHGPPPS